MKRGFTLVELIVVIGIIGVLAGVLFASFSGGTDAARAAKCLTNMRNLAQATISCAANRTGQSFPPAGSFATLNQDNGKVICIETVGWISWLSMSDEYGMRKGSASHPKSFISIKNASAYSAASDAENKDANFALENGAIWHAVNGNKEIYVCPDHARKAEKKGVRVNWSYIMSAYFGYDWTDGSKVAGAGGSSNNSVSLSSSRLDRTLLFAELPFNDHEYGGASIDTEFSTSASTENDCVLQYKGGTIDGDTFDNKWNGKAESIAFNHKSGKRWCAHVVFADGHTEKLLLPTSGGVSREQLTALLCGDDNYGGGKDVSFDGRQYQKMDN